MNVFTNFDPSKHVLETNWGWVTFDEPEHPSCKHEYVNVSFMQIKMVCKHCNQEQPR